MNIINRKPISKCVPHKVKNWNRGVLFNANAIDFAIGSKFKLNGSIMTWLIKKTNESCAPVIVKASFWRIKTKKQIIEDIKNPITA